LGGRQFQPVPSRMKLVVFGIGNLLQKMVEQFGLANYEFTQRHLLGSHLIFSGA